MVVDTDGEQKAAEPADEEFDPSVIPKRRWQAYEDEIFDDKKANDNPVNQFPDLRPPTPIVSPKWLSPYTSPDTDIGTFTGVRELYDSKESMSWETMQDTFPSDEAIVSALYNLLETADLKIVTKKQGRNKIDGGDLPAATCFLSFKLKFPFSNMKMTSTSRAFQRVWNRHGS